MSVALSPEQLDTLIERETIASEMTEYSDVPGYDELQQFEQQLRNQKRRPRGSHK